jgi:ubiquinone/menaquinone biosynthesis C-methylase UbiE
VAEHADRWARWLCERRSGGDPGVEDRIEPHLRRWRDLVLAGAAISPGDAVLDLGTGTGLIAFGALDLVGDDGEVIFTDVSDQLLGVCRVEAERLGALDRCRFLRCPADRVPVAAGRVDVVTARSVLIYLDDKAPAFREAFRVLRPGGRLSIFEPINRFAYPEPDHLFLGFDVGPVRDLVVRIRAARLPVEEHPLTNFDERDLFDHAAAAGFDRIEMEYTARLEPPPLDTTDWDVLLAMACNPLDPTVGEQIAAALTPDEQARFEACLRPLVEAGAPRRGRSATVLLRAVR